MAANQYITPDSIRMFLMDRCAKDNFLLDAQEFSAEQIQFACELMVDNFNTTNPIMPQMYQNWENFQYRYEGLLGITACLLRMKAVNLVRNRLPGNGQIVDDHAIADSYLKLAQDYQREFESRVRVLKSDYNINGPSSYSRLGGETQSSFGWT